MTIPHTKPFLHSCIEDIVTKHGTDFSHTIILLPNRRPELFIKNYLSSLIKDAFFLPKFITIQDFFASNSSLVIEDNLLLIYNLYHEYKAASQSNESFEEFYSWGEMLLSDFNDIDTYLIDYKNLFANIQAIKDFENIFDFLSQEQVHLIQRFWNVVEQKPESHIKAKFISIWKVLGVIYENFNKNLREKNIAYKGMLHRQVVQNLPNSIDLPPETTIFAIGFNALNECELKLFDFFKSSKKGYFYWDYDVYYNHTESAHEASYFLQKNIERYGNELPEDYFNNFKEEKSITIIETPNTLSQVKEFEYIKQLAHTDNHAIVLADEQLLLPLLQSIPEQEVYNVSLGMNIAHTEAYNVFDALMQLQENKHTHAFYTKDLKNICSFEIIKQIFADSYSKINEATAHNFSFTHIKSIEWDEATKNFFVCSSNSSYTEYLKLCLQTLINYKKDSEVLLSVWYALYTTIENIETICNSYDITPLSVQFINATLRKAAKSLHIPIEGEPLQGIQIMGILETRLLDFESITILSLNENILPKKTIGSSFIPYSLRVGFGMPTIKEHNSIFAYYFYRLLQRASRITLCYSTQTEDMGLGEQSRYITQLEREYIHYNPQVKIEKKYSMYPVYPNEEKPIFISKNSTEFKEFVDALQKGTKELSPTALYKFIVCPLQFYFAVIKKLRKPDEIKELPDERDYGNFVHKALETIYENHKNTTLTADTIREIIRNDAHIKTTVKNIVSQEITDQSIEVPVQIVSKYVTRALEYDQTIAPFTITGLEQEIKYTFAIDNHTTISLKGIIDRVHKQGGDITILDYKTGKNTIACNSIEEIFSDEHAHHNSAIFQIFLYSYILQDMHKDKNIRPSLLFLRDYGTSNERYSKITVQKQSIDYYSEIGDDYYHLLCDTLTRLLDKTIDFAQTKDNKSCAYCDYNHICNR